MNKDFVRRNYEFECRAEQDAERGSVLVGRPIVYDSKTDIGGWFSEIIERGALEKTDLTDVRFLVNHDTSKIPLARSRKNTDNSTMKLTVDKDGMGIRVSLDTENNTEARNLYSAVERGDISGMSFMFVINDEEWEDLDSDYPTRHIKGISSVIEVSAVTFPAYEETSISARDKSALESARNAVETARRGAVETTPAKSVETDKNALEIEKLKIEILNGGF